jgi:hypothetical protein
MKTKSRPYPPGHSVGANNPRARLSETEVRGIRKRYAEGGGGKCGGPSQRELGEEYVIRPTPEDAEILTRLFDESETLYFDTARRKLFSEEEDLE